MKEQNEHIAAALQALRNFTAQSDPSERELSAVQVASSIINDLGGTSAYNVLASLICGFTAAQPSPWQALSYIIQGCLSGWNVLAQEEATKATKH